MSPFLPSGPWQWQIMDHLACLITLITHWTPLIRTASWHLALYPLSHTHWHIMHDSSDLGLPTNRFKRESVKLCTRRLDPCFPLATPWVVVSMMMDRQRERSTKSEEWIVSKEHLREQGFTHLANSMQNLVMIIIFTVDHQRTNALELIRTKR